MRSTPMHLGDDKVKSKLIDNVKEWRLGKLESMGNKNEKELKGEKETKEQRKQSATFPCNP